MSHLHSSLEDTCCCQLRERQVITIIWENIQQLLSDKSVLSIVLRDLSRMLAPVDSIPPTALQSLAMLHIGSCKHLNYTGMILAAAAGKGAPQARHSPVLGVNSIADKVPLGVVSNLIELQLFHLFRVRAIAAQMRAYCLPFAVVLPRQQISLYAGARDASGSSGSSKCSPVSCCSTGTQRSELESLSTFEETEGFEVVPVLNSSDSSKSSVRSRGVRRH